MDNDFTGRNEKNKEEDGWDKKMFLHEMYLYAIGRDQWN